MKFFPTLECHEHLLRLILSDSVLHHLLNVWLFESEVLNHLVSVLLIVLVETWSVTWSEFSATGMSGTDSLTTCLFPHSSERTNYRITDCSSRSGYISNSLFTNLTNKNLETNEPSELTQQSQGPGGNPTAQTQALMHDPCALSHEP